MLGMGACVRDRHNGGDDAMVVCVCGGLGWT